MAAQIISEIHARGRLPLLVGGTGQYIRAVTEGWSPPGVAENSRLRNELGRMKDEKGAEWLHAKLKTLDEEAAEKIDWRNARRTIRALEVIFATGKKFSAQRGQAESPYGLVSVGLIRPRAELYKRIDERIEAMFAGGFLNEVKNLLKQGYPPNLPSMSAIGYREGVKVLNGETTEEQAKAEMRRITRVFVRRQGNWFKESDPRIRWFHPEEEDALEKIARYILDETRRKAL